MAFMGKTNLALATAVAFAVACGSRPAARPPATGGDHPAAAPRRAVLLESTAIDQRLRAEWAKTGITPAKAADDATFLRRASLDLTGRIPTADAVSTFLADRAPDKRAKLVDALLASPAYADHFTNVWDRILLGRDARPNLVDRVAFRKWLHDGFANDVRYDRFVFELLTATGRNSVGGRPFRDPAAHEAGVDESDGNEPIHGAVNWFLKFDKNLPDLAGTTSRIFLGVQIQCAQCHDHKTEAWKMTDFQSFTACFARTRIERVEKGKVMGVRRVEVRDTNRPIRPPKQMDAAAFANAAPRALDGTDFSTSANRRRALAEWMIAPKNPWFAKEIVNRTWAQMLGRGFFEPVDDFRASNPALLPDLLERLADDFVASGYDLKHLLRIIALSEAYQLAPAGSAHAEGDALWSRFQITRLGPDELLDALAEATRLGARLERRGESDDGRARFALRRQFAFVFDVDEDGDHHDEFDGTVSQALWLMNGQLVNRAASALPGTALGEILAARGDDASKVRAIYLRALSREPSADETARALAIVNEAAPPDHRAAWEDIFWAVLDSSEFLFNH